jgi:membrane dipeptidase
MYRRIGVLSMTLTHFRSNDWADSSTGKQEHNGLTEFGKQVVREMNRIGMIVDISHVSDRTFYDTPFQLRQRTLYGQTQFPN